MSCEDRVDTLDQNKTMAVRMIDSLAGWVALVTGAGIGRAICERLAADDVRLVLVDIDARATASVASSIKVEYFYRDTRRQ